MRGYTIRTYVHTVVEYLDWDYNKNARHAGRTDRRDKLSHVLRHIQPVTYSRQEQTWKDWRLVSLLWIQTRIRKICKTVYVNLNKHTVPPIAVQYMRIVSKCLHKSAKHSYAKQWLAPATKYHRGMYAPNRPTVKDYWHTQQKLFLSLSKLRTILLQLSLQKSDPDSNECHRWVLILLTSFNNKLAERLLWELRRGRWRFALPRRLLLAHFRNAKCVTCISDKTYCIQSMV